MKSSCLALSASTFPANGAKLSGAKLSVEGLLAIVRTVSRSTAAESSTASSPGLAAIPPCCLVSKVDEGTPSTATNGFAENGSFKTTRKKKVAVPAALRDELRGLDPWEYVKASRGFFKSGISRLYSVRKSRALKRRLVVAAEHFNRSPKRHGLTCKSTAYFLKISQKAVAKFLKLARLGDKESRGTLGDPKDFQVEVLKEYAPDIQL